MEQKEGWNLISELPDKSMKVEWLCEDGKKDVGFYYKENEVFASIDLITHSPITHWKKLEL